MNREHLRLVGKDDAADLALPALPDESYRASPLPKTSWLRRAWLWVLRRNSGDQWSMSIGKDPRLGHGVLLRVGQTEIFFRWQELLALPAWLCAKSDYEPLGFHRSDGVLLVVPAHLTILLKRRVLELDRLYGGGFFIRKKGTTS